MSSVAPVGKRVIAEKESIDAPPLDFSFQQAKDLEKFRTCQPKTGKRKEIIIAVEEIKPEEKKDSVKVDEKETERQRSNSHDDKSEQMENEDLEKEEEKEEKQVKQEKNGKDQKKKEDIKKSPEQLLPMNFQAQNIIQLHNIPLNNNMGKVVGSKNLENKNKYKNTCIKINRVCVQLVLCQNQLRSLVNFYNVFDSIMYDVKRLQLIDVSFNYLETLDYNFADFPQLQTLYIHCNYISNLNDISQLSILPNLRSLSVYGNPIEQIPNIRYFIIGRLKNLKRVDSVLVSKKERDNSEVFLTKFKFQPKNLGYHIRRPPQEEQNESQNDASKSQL